MNRFLKGMSSKSLASVTISPDVPFRMNPFSCSGSSRLSILGSGGVGGVLVIVGRKALGALGNLDFFFVFNLLLQKIII